MKRKRKMASLKTKKKYRVMLVLLLFIVLIIFAVFLIIALKEKKESHNDYNVILIDIDSLRADHLGCYWYEKNTSPAIDKLSKDSA